jgi:hypothetical protein
VPAVLVIIVHLTRFGTNDGVARPARGDSAVDHPLTVPFDTHVRGPGQCCDGTIRGDGTGRRLCCGGGEGIEPLASSVRARDGSPLCRPAFRRWIPTVRGEVRWRDEGPYIVKARVELTRSETGATPRGLAVLPTAEAARPPASEASAGRHAKVDDLGEVGLPWSVGWRRGRCQNLQWAGARGSGT